jgi:hypothetical protein
MPSFSLGQKKNKNNFLSQPLASHARMQTMCAFSFQSTKGKQKSPLGATGFSARR